jgi:energy-coupling factor transport system ATP-binding protein
MSGLIELRDVSYRYTSSSAGWVLEDVNLQIEPGQYVLLCGASGSGKSTLCRLLNGLIPHFYGGELEGRVAIDGLDTRQHSVGELYGRVGMIFQNPTVQLFNSTVERELAYGLESLGLPRDEIARRVRESAEMAGITPLLDRNPQQLSGGEQQLTAIAAVLALHPRLIVLDEPYASLDPLNVRRVRDVLQRIRAARFVSGTNTPVIVIAEHRLEHVAPDADHVVVLQGGRVALRGTPQQVLAQDVAPYGLNVPPVVRAGHALGLPEVPLTVEQLVEATDGRRVEVSPVALETALRAALRAQSPCATVATQSPRDDLVLQAEGVTFTFGGAPALAGVDLALHAGESLALVGANGSGKTTLIKHFNGLHRPRQGRVTVLGQDTRRARVSTLARHVGMVFQNANDQFFKYAVRDEIEVGAHVLGRYDARWMDELVDLFHLGPLLDRSPYRLSEGEKKRVAFASALMARPEILVLDEPTTGQDWPFRRALGDLLARLSAHKARADRRAVVLVTHDLEFAECCAGRWALLAGGRVAAAGRPGEVMADSAAMARAGLEATQAWRIRRAFGIRQAPGEVGR